MNGQGEESSVVRWAEGGSVKEAVKYNSFSALSRMAFTVPVQP